MFADGESSDSLLLHPSQSGPQRLVSGTVTHASDPYTGTTIDGRYVVERIIGEGGMGVVYAAHHQAIGKRVALKILRVDMAGDREIVERFTNEARAASAVGSPHIVDITDFGRLPDGSAYFVMEYLDGPSLGDEIARCGMLSLDRVVKLGKQIALGLQAAHERGVVHRDLKPDNIMLASRQGEGDFAKILDFGIAKLGKASMKLTKAGAVFGTPHYMAPEQAAGQPVDHRADIYSLGIILYELCAGRVPFDGENFMSILTQHMQKAPIRLVNLLPGFPRNLDAVISKCLAKSTEQRYQTMSEVVADLERVERGNAAPEAEGSQVSGYFRIPADYFPSRPQMPSSPRLPQRTAMPASFSIPYSPTGGGAVSGAIYAGASFAAVVVLGLAAFLGVRRAPPIMPEARGMAIISPFAVNEAGRTLARMVQLDVTPQTATATRGDTAYGAQSVAPVPVGQEVVFAVSAPGFESIKVVVDDTTLDVVTVKLKKIDPSKPAPTATPPATAASPQRPRCGKDETFIMTGCVNLFKKDGDHK